jgi:hypothetical protein
MPVGRKYLEELLSRPPADTGSEVKRKAGDMINRVIDGLRGIDDDYTTRINDMYKGSGPIMRSFGAVLGGGHPSLRKGTVEQDIYGPERRITQGTRQALEYALPAISAVPKYVIPAAGVALAGRGVSDIVDSFGGPADQQQPGELSLSQAILGVAALGTAGYGAGQLYKQGSILNNMRDDIDAYNVRNFRPFSM